MQSSRSGLGSRRKVIPPSYWNTSKRWGRIPQQARWLPRSATTSSRRLASQSAKQWPTGRQRRGGAEERQHDLETEGRARMASSSRSRAVPPTARMTRPSDCQSVPTFLRHRVRAQAANWKSMGAPPCILTLVQRGVRIQCTRRSPDAFHKGGSLTNLTPAQQEWWRGERARLMEAGAWESVELS